MGLTPTVAIIGPGRVGTAIGVLAPRYGYRVVGVGGRRLETARRAAELIEGDPVACDILTAAARAELVLLTVSDDSIGTVAAELVEHEALEEGASVVHLSGALSSTVIAAVRQLGCYVASAHPMQTFSNVESAIRGLNGCYWFCEGDPEALETMGGLIAALDGHVVDISADRKVDYHLSAVFACNYLVVLMDVALTMAERAGIDRKTAWAALSPMIGLTLSNVGEMGARAALSGPIRRGDYDTIVSHLATLPSQAEAIGDLYRVLGAWATELCREEGYLGDEIADRLLAQLSGEPDQTPHVNDPNPEA
ncbi:MAG: DUF2520 domain-containing protein [Gammaproteobacteria bacterium]|nr:DUF2520 domain-containing protein [Gammaproteobacteria bacterium]